MAASCKPMVPRNMQATAKAGLLLLMQEPMSKPSIMVASFFSDWIRGYGLVLIIDHGRGYLSLYAHNQSLLRDIGSWVNQGDIIASVGRSGGMDFDALYFRSEEHTSELQSRPHLVCRLLLEKKN